MADGDGMTTPSYRSEAHAGDIASPPTVAKPAGVVAGDVLVAIVCYQGATLADGPAGWTSLSSLTGTGGFVSSRVFTRTVDGTEGSSFTFTNPDGSVEAVCIVAIADATVTGLAFDKLEGSGGSTSMTSPSVTASNPGSMLVFLGAHGFDLATATPPGGFTERVDFGLTSALIDRSVYAATAVQSAAGATGTKTATLSGSGTYGAHGWMVVLPPSNLPPNAPNPITPVGGAVFDRSLTQRFRWEFSDPDAGDSQSAYELQYRLVGAGSWTTVTGTTPNQFHDFAGGTFTAGDYEWQARTTDAHGETGPFSSSAFFTAAVPSGAPSITAPINGSTIPTSTALVSWSIASQDSYQLRRTSDLAGTTVYFDTGEVVSSSTRSLTVAFPTNNRFEYIQVRSKDGGLWTDWGSVQVEVSYATPAAPLVTILEDVPTGAISVEAEHPTPSGSQPSVAYMNVWRRETADGGDGIRIARDLAPSATFTDWFVASGRDYEYQVEAVGDNNASSFSDWTGGDVIPGETSAFPSTSLFPSTDLFPATA